MKIDEGTFDFSLSAVLPLLKR